MQFREEVDKASGNRVYTITVSDTDFRTPTLDASDREDISQCAKGDLVAAKLWGLALLQRRIE
jgi:hypothetical protein